MDDLMRKVQGLLAKAQSTDNEHEAEAFNAKAMELIQKYAIDEALLRSAMGARGAAVRPGLFDFQYSTNDSNAKSLAQLLFTVAGANRVRMIDYSNRRYSNAHRPGNSGVASQWCGLVGYAADVEFTKVLYASLLAQAARFGRADFRATGRASGKSRFMTAYLYGFSAGVREQFAAQGRAALDSSTSALMTRVKEEVDEAFAEFFPKTRSVGFSLRDGQGVAMGRVSGARADIGNPGVASGALRLRSGR